MDVEEASAARFVGPFSARTFAGRDRGCPRSPNGRWKSGIAFNICVALPLMFNDSPTTDEYQFWRLYSNMVSAAHAGELLATESRQVVKYALLKDLVIAYSRPFSANCGKILYRHCLVPEWVPVRQRELHAELMALRNRVFAHTDHEFRDPRVSRCPYQVAPPIL